MDIHSLNCMISGSQLEMNMDSFEMYWGAESLQMVPELLEVASLLWLRYNGVNKVDQYLQSQRQPPMLPNAYINRPGLAAIQQSGDNVNLASR